LLLILFPFGRTRSIGRSPEVNKAGECTA
jgi:hypothetical protein